VILLAVFALGVATGAGLVGLFFVRPLRKEIRALTAHLAVLDRRLGPWIKKADDTFSEHEIPTKR
jgi:hypothetical protein